MPLFDSISIANYYHSTGAHARFLCEFRHNPPGRLKPHSPLPQTLTPRPLHRAEQVVDHPSVPGLDLGREVHARAQGDALAVDGHVFLAQRQDGGVVGAFLFLGHGVGADHAHLRRHRAVAGVGEGFELDGGNLPGVHKADVQVGDGNFGADAGAVGHNDHEGLGRGDDAAHRVDGQLLDDAGHGGGELGEAFALACLGVFGDELLLAGAGLGMAFAQLALGFGAECGPGLLRFMACRLRLGQAGALGGQVLFEFDAFAGFVLGGVAGDVALADQALEVGFALARHGHGGFEFGDGGSHGGRFSLAALGFGVEFGQLGADVFPFALQ